jgi:transketolase
MRDRFIKTLLEIAKKDKNVYLVTGEVGFGVLKPFWNQVPDQLINAGIAEQNMTSLAAGMALEGKIVFTYSIGNFPTMRCLEQIRNDCAYHNANVKVVCVGGGLVYGSLGVSHHATEDLAIMRALPNVTVLAPGDLLEAECATKAVYEHEGTCYLRIGRGHEKQLHDSIDNFEIGKAIKIKDGEKIAIFSTGAIFDEAIEASRILEEHGINASLYTFPTVKPIDRETIEACANNCDWIVTLEEHNIIGGFGGGVAEVLAEMGGSRAKLMRIGLNDEYSSVVGNHKYLREVYGLSAEKIAHRIEGVLALVPVMRNKKRSVKDEN